MAARKLSSIDKFLTSKAQKLTPAQLGKLHDDLRLEIFRLRKQADDLGRELDNVLEGNAQGHRQLILALDGGDIPEGLLNSADALEPFARYGATLIPGSDDTLVLGPRSGTGITVGHFRDATATLAWVRRARRKRGLK